ncbi:uncharacterized protein [Anabrus simplex]|uniref:uncharacterized protein n=1 Tax=Anabrus simplex TaxID=316456 RepID=UPI0035A32D90
MSYVFKALIEGYHNLVLFQIQIAYCTVGEVNLRECAVWLWNIGSRRSLVIQGQEMEPCERARDSTACAYSSYYHTDGLSPSKKGQREDLTIIMKVQGSGELSTCLQIKLYKQHDTQHCEWGSRLHCIELDCIATEGAEEVRVNRETYRAIPSFSPDPSPDDNICCGACTVVTTVHDTRSFIDTATFTTPVKTVPEAVHQTQLPRVKIINDEVKSNPAKNQEYNNTSPIHPPEERDKDPVS